MDMIPKARFSNMVWWICVEWYGLVVRCGVIGVVVVVWVDVVVV